MLDPHPYDSSTDDKIVDSLEKVAQAIRVLLWNQSKEHALSPLQVQILLYLLRQRPENRKVSALAAEFDMSKATISDTVKTLGQKGLIIREREEKDTRSFVIHLTERGRQIAETTSVFARQIRTPIRNMPQSDKENLLLSLMDIIRHLNRAGVITVQRMCATCAHYSPPEGGRLHFCNLLNQELHATDLRIDCPEHVLKKE